MKITLDRDFKDNVVIPVVACVLLGVGLFSWILYQSQVQGPEYFAPRTDCVYLSNGAVLKGRAEFYFSGSVVSLRSGSTTVDYPASSVLKIERRCLAD